MIGAVSDCSVPLENQAEFEKLMSDFIRYTRRQPGCIYYDFGRVTGNSTQYIVVQKWATEADLENYLADPEFRLKVMKIIKLAKDLLAVETFNLLI